MQNRKGGAMKKFDGLFFLCFVIYLISKKLLSSYISMSYISGAFILLLVILFIIRLRLKEKQ